MGCVQVGVIDRFLHFCQLKIKPNGTFSLPHHTPYGGCRTINTLLENFELFVSARQPGYPDVRNLPEFLQKIELVRKLLFEIET